MASLRRSVLATLRVGVTSTAVGVTTYLMMKGKQAEERSCYPDEACTPSESPKFPPTARDGEPRLVVFQHSPNGKWHGFLEIYKVNPYTEDGGHWIPERDIPMATCQNMPVGWRPTELQDMNKDKLVSDLRSAADTAWQEVLNEKHQEETTEKFAMTVPPSGSQKRIV